MRELTKSYLTCHWWSPLNCRCSVLARLENDTFHPRSSLQLLECQEDAALAEGPSHLQYFASPACCLLEAHHPHKTASAGPATHLSCAYVNFAVQIAKYNKDMTTSAWYATRMGRRGQLSELACFRISVVMMIPALDTHRAAQKLMEFKLCKHGQAFNFSYSLSSAGCHTASRVSHQRYRSPVFASSKCLISRMVAEASTRSVISSPEAVSTTTCLCCFKWRFICRAESLLAWLHVKVQPFPSCAPHTCRMWQSDDPLDLSAKMDEWAHSQHNYISHSQERSIMFSLQ